MDLWRPNRPQKRNDFEVAIICALTLEADAVTALFDHDWEDDGFSYGKAEGDPNAYSIGAIGQHNVVLAHVPGLGKVSAGNIAASCRTSFPNIKLALLVGICGGAPTYNKGKRRIRLGDVIISTGIVQYDFGRRFPDQFKIKDNLNDIPGRPNLEIRSLLSKLMTTRESDRLQTESWKYLNEPRQDAKRPATFPGRSKDLLFPVDYRHKHQDSLACAICASCHREKDPVCDIALNSSCEQMGCDMSQCLQRDDRGGGEPRPLIHFGTFATGDTVMKSAKDRDYITKKTQALGFEMESAGVWEAFPCVVVKSVCDYADSHKSKDWQPYAAACAAAYAKGFLGYWDSKRKAESISESEQFRKRIIQSLSYSDMNERRNNIPSEAPSTFNWIFEESTQSHRQRRHWDSFVKWLKSDLPVYWITGKPGSGKSTLMKFLVSDSRTRNALKEWKKGVLIIGHFFWKPGSEMQHSFKGLLCSLLRSILENDKSISNRSLQRMLKDKRRKEVPSDWDQRELRDLLLYYRNHSSQPTCIFIDALDEISPEQDTLDALSMLRALISPTIKICVSSRPERLFRLDLQDKPSLKIHELTGPDIEQYAKVSIRDSILLRPHGLRVSDLAKDVGEQSQGVFLWAVLVTRSLIRGINNGDSKRDIYRRLNSTPRDLMDLYRDILVRSAADRDIYRQSASMMFNLVLVLKGEPMPLFEATVAKDESLLDRFVVRGKGIPAQNLITKCLRVVKTLEVGCAGLLEVHSSMKDRPPTLKSKPLLAWFRTTITFIHRSAKEFLIDTEDGRKLWDSCPCSQEELLIRRAKAKLAWYELYPSLDIVSEMRFCELSSVLQTLAQWIRQTSLPSTVSTTMLTFAQKMYERGSLLAPEFLGELLPLRSRRGQFLVYAVFSGLTTFALKNLETFPDSERQETAYYMLYNSCACSDPLDEEGYGEHNHRIVKLMIESGYSPNWPGSSEMSTSKFGSPWLRYLLTLHNQLSDETECIRLPSEALKVLATIRMFLKYGANIHSKFKVVFSWTRPAGRWDSFDIDLGVLWSHHTQVLHAANTDFLILEINGNVLLKSILLELHTLVRPEFRLELPEAVCYMKALGFGNYRRKKYFVVDNNRVSERLLDGVQLWFQEATRKSDDVKMKDKVRRICNYATDEASEASCRKGRWPF